MRNVSAAAQREIVVRTSVLRAQRELRRAARTGERVLVGPFLGEVGYELEYWIPFARRELRRHGIAADRVTIVSRGGAGAWYRDFAEHAVDVLELIPADRYAAELEGRRARARDLKQLRNDRFDRKLTALALERTGPAVAMHPSLMFAELRGLWFKDLPVSAALDRLEYRQLAVDPERPPGVTGDYVAVKAYFNQCFPATGPNRAFLRALIERLAEVADVVLLATGLALDDHEEWSTQHESVHPVGDLLRPEDNLAVQARIIAGARALVATYGGFSYLGPFLGVPALTFSEVEQTVPVHLELLRAAAPEAVYERAHVSDGAVTAAFVDRLGAAVRR